MEERKLWKELDNWKKNCKFVELSYEVSPTTPHWSGFPDMSVTKKFDYADGTVVFCRRRQRAAYRFGRITVVTSLRSGCIAKSSGKCRLCSNRAGSFGLVSKMGSDSATSIRSTAQRLVETRRFG